MDRKGTLAKRSLHLYVGSVTGDRVLVTDVRALRALAHPLRNRLLGLLRLHGPSTATRLGELVGESSGSTSYHLRQLADWGFVEDAGGLGTGRERWWRARHRVTSWESEDLLDQEGGAQVQDEMLRLQLTGHTRVLQAWMSQREELGPQWAAAASVNDYALRLTPGQARELARELEAVLSRWVADHPSDTPVEGSETVGVLLDVVPLREWPA
jgi:DNA-binding transcriptional ArsR family regulator